MNMFWRKSRASVSDPDELMRRLRRVFNRAHERDLFTLDDLVNEVKAERKESVAFLLSQLASNEIIDEVIRVDSPRGGGIREYKSINEIESPLFDPYQREDIDVEPKLIKVFFRKRSSADKSAAVSAHRDHAHA
jgi:hypothetical protein